MKSIYIVLSRTSTKISKVIRIFTNSQFNHVSISLDENLNQIYGFTRQQYQTPFLGRLVKESITHYTLNKEDEVPIKVYKIPVSDEMYTHVNNKVLEIFNDPEYIYNLFSVISYPITKGFETYKAFSCIEFAMMILKEIGFEVEKPFHQYMPDDLQSILKECLFYEGDIRGIMSEENIDVHFFDDVSMKDQFENVTRFYILCKRSISREIFKNKEE